MSSDKLVTIPESIACVALLLFYIPAVQLTVDTYQPDLEQLEFVAILHRHGDRAPLRTYKNDPYINYPWPGGLAALTPAGSLQLYNMGKHLRSRYKRLLPTDDIYTKENMQVLSSSRPRCLKSVESLLAGLIPPNEDENPLPIPWQPVAVKPLPADTDSMLYQEIAPCAKYDKLYNKFLNDPDPDTEFYQENKKLQHLYPYFSEHSGENITNMAQAGDLGDTLLVQSMIGLEVPPWAKPYFPDVLYGARVRAYRVYTETPYMLRIRSGPILTEIFKQMKLKQYGRLTRKIHIYSAHDATVYFLLNALNAVNQTTIMADYAATVAVELYRDRNDKWTVNVVHYWNSDQKTPKQLLIPQCPPPCTLSRFENAVRENLVYDFAKECEL